MNERDKLIDEYGSASGHVLDIGLIEYLGYRLVATEGPEIEAMVERARKGMFETVPHSAWRKFNELGDATAAREIVSGILRAALETGERDG